jgi:hypothetical protein
MSKTFFVTLLSHANYQIREMSVNIIRAQRHMLVEKSIDNALADLKRTQELLEQAKESYKLDYSSSSSSEVSMGPSKYSYGSAKPYLIK